VGNKRVIRSLSQEAENRSRRAIEVAVRETNREFGEGTIMRASDMLAAPPRLTTGSLWFDLALGGGWPVNAWSEIVGLESSGKTALAYNTIACGMANDPNFTALWCAAEPFDEEYARDIGVDLSRLWVLEENVMEIVYSQVTKYVEERAVDMAVIDAYPSLITDAEDVGAMGDAHVSPGARLTNQFMRKATKATKRSRLEPGDRPFTGLFINQWRDKITMFGDPRTTPGGKGKNFWFASRVELSRDEWIKDADGYGVGQAIRMKVFKNKGARPQRDGLCDFYFDDTDGRHCGEFDDLEGIIRLSLNLEVVERRGNSYYFQDEKLASKKGDLELAIRSEPALAERVATAIRVKELGAPPPQPKARVLSMPRERRPRPGSRAA
jgi:recombination protein RecA